MTLYVNLVVYCVKNTFNVIQTTYKQDHEETKDKNHFNVTSTPVYNQIKEHEGLTSDVSD